MSDAPKKALLDEAVQIFLRLEAEPENETLQQQRDAFLARGENEQEAYQKVVDGWQVTGVKPGSRKLSMAVLAVGLALTGYLVSDPITLALYADLTSGRTPVAHPLESGDTVTLDAASALADHTSEPRIRSVTLMKGAAFFNVTKQQKPFVVDVGALQVEAIGTAFETAILGNDVLVQVEEGIVRVTSATNAWQLEAGDSFYWKDDASVATSTGEVASVAGWRNDQLVVEGVSFNSIAEVIERRLPGHIVVVGDALANATVSGSFDLSQPRQALEILAATQDATILAGQPFATFVFLRN